MPAVGIVFELRRAESRPGETLQVLGGAPELGSWGSEDTAGLQLRTSVSVYPLWTMLEPVWIEVPEDKEEILIEYKYVKDLGPWSQAGKRTMWEDGIDNRSVKVPCVESNVWVVSDERWELAGAPELRETLESEITRRRNMLDPDPLTRRTTVPFVPFSPRGESMAAQAKPREAYCLTPSQTSPPRARNRYAIEADYDRLDHHIDPESPPLSVVHRGADEGPDPALLAQALLAHIPGSPEQAPGPPPPTARVALQRQAEELRRSVGEVRDGLQDERRELEEIRGLRPRIGYLPSLMKQQNATGAFQWDQLDAAPGPALSTQPRHRSEGSSAMSRDGRSSSTTSNPEVCDRECLNPEVAGYDWQHEMEQLRRENERLRGLLRSAGSEENPPATDVSLAKEEDPASSRPPPRYGAVEHSELMRVLTARRDRIHELEQLEAATKVRASAS